MLFCDVVGFTATSETVDPEDVHARMGLYYEQARDAIESFGGTIEKFIGDAVMAVFGAPAYARTTRSGQCGRRYGSSTRCGS